jgi:Fuc2NAc and GlcNAc transferase
LGWLRLVVVLYFFGIVPENLVWVFSPLLLIVIISFIDDRFKLSAGTRLIFQSIAALGSLLVIGESGQLVQHLLDLPLPFCFLAVGFGIVWMINLFNFMDGSDGIAATEAIFVFAVGGFLLFKVSANEMATLAWGLVAMLAGFLAWNWPTARIFMGDCGSCFLGMLVALFALISHLKYQMPLMVWFLLTAVFWFDATITLVRRIIAGDRWREPHRLHAYQRLIQVGWSHQKVLLGLIAVNCILSALAIMVFNDPKLQYFALGLAVMILFCLYILIEVAKPMYKTWYSGSAATKDS